MAHRGDDWENHNPGASVASVAAIYPPPAEVAPQPALVRRPQKKAAKHRKRHVPVGPAGVLFQQTLQQHPGKRQRNEAPLNRNEIDDEDDNDGASSCGYSISQSRCSPTAASTAYTSPAWTAAQCALELSTPSCPFHWTFRQKYAALRPHLPAEYLLVPQILNGAADWKMAPHQKLLVQVVTIQAVTANDHLWTVSLTDETGATVQAWIEPAWVRKEQQQQASQIRAGTLWLLQNCSIQLIANNNSNSNDATDDTQQQMMMDRMLLVSPDNVISVWNSSTNVSNAEYIRWMEARNALTATLLSNRAPEISSQLESDDEADVDADNEPVNASNLSPPPPPPPAAAAAASRQPAPQQVHRPPVPPQRPPQNLPDRPVQQQQQQQQDIPLCRLQQLERSQSTSPVPTQHTRQAATAQQSNNSQARGIGSHAQRSNVPLNPYTNSTGASVPAANNLQNASPVPPPARTPPPSILRRRSSVGSAPSSNKSVNFKPYEADETKTSFLTNSQHSTPASPATDNGDSCDSNKGGDEDASNRQQSTPLREEKDAPGGKRSRKSPSRTSSSRKKKKKRKKSVTPKKKRSKSTSPSQLFSSKNTEIILLELSSEDEDDDDAEKYDSTAAPFHQQQSKPVAKENDPPLPLSRLSDSGTSSNDKPAAGASSLALFQVSDFAGMDMDDFDDDDDDE